MNEKETKKYSELISSLTSRGRSLIRELDPENDLIFLRVRTKQDEIMIAPDKEFMLVVIQKIET